MRQLSRMVALAGYRPVLYAAVTLLWTAIHLAPLVPGLIAKEFFDTLTGESRLGIDLWGLVALLGATALAQVVVLYGGFHTDLLLRFSMRMLLRHNLLADLLARPGALPLPRPVGEILSNLREDVLQVEDSVDWTIDVAGTALFAVAALAILAAIDARLTLLVFGPLIAVLALVRAMGTRLGRYRESGRRATAQVTSAIREMFESVQAIQLAGAEAHVLRRFAEQNEARRGAMVRDAVLTQVLQSSFSQTATLGTGLVLLLGASSMQRGSFSVGDFALFVYYLGFVTDFTGFFGNFLAHYRQTGVSFERLDAIRSDPRPEALTAPAPLHLRGALPSPAPPIHPVRALQRLEVRDLGCVYASTGRGVRGIDLCVDGADRLTLVTGRIGSGKTTLLRAILGLLPRQSGTLVWNGEPVQDAAAFFVPPHCAYTPQSPRLRAGSLRENVLQGLPASRAALDRALWLAALDEDLGVLPAGLETRVGARGVRLSGGQLQRVALARMFVRDAALWVFDDLSSALDVETESRVLSRVLEHGGTPCLGVSHRRPVLARADAISVLREGRLEAQGRAEELLRTSSELQRLWRAESPD